MLHSPRERGLKDVADDDDRQAHRLHSPRERGLKVDQFNLLPDRRSYIPRASGGVKKYGNTIGFAICGYIYH